MKNNELVSSTFGSNPSIIVKQKFDKATASYADYMLNHKGRDQNITDLKNDQDILSQSIINKNGKYSDYVEYGAKDYATALEKDVNQNLTPTFNNEKNNLTKRELETIKKHINVAAKNNNLMWKTVISFSDNFLIKQRIMDNAKDRNLDQKRLKVAIRNQMKAYLRSEGIDTSAEWFGNIHLRGDKNQKHIHVHLAIFEQETKREMKFNSITNKQEPRGLFKQKHLNKFKSNILKATKLDRTIEKERELLINKQVILKDYLDLVSKKEFYKKEWEYFDSLLKVLPDNKKKWRAKSNSLEMKPANKLAQKIVDNFLNASESNNFKEFTEINLKLKDIYTESYGSNKKTDAFVENKVNEFKEQLINRMYNTLKTLPTDKYTIDDGKTSLEKHQAIKITLENKVKEMKRNKQTVPKNVVKELGRQKHQIQIINAKNRIKIIDQDLLKLSDLTDDLSEYYRNKLHDEKEYFNLKLIPNFKLSDEQKELKQKLKIQVSDILKVGVNDVDDNYVSQKNRKIKAEKALILENSDNALKALFKEKKQSRINTLDTQLKILNDKFNIHKNNILLKNKDLDHAEKRHLLQDNRQYFNHIKYLTPDFDDESEKLINKKDRNYPNSHESSIRLKQSGVDFVLKSLAQTNMQLNLNNKSEERALSAYEMEQARINQIEKEKER
ncbi:relaxase MobL [Fructilactobacillus sanfranciscensis]|uniref:relaxase MobL n=1 Tax=Fructilactobacillus sanfranciscensis TaxID=1625 RepID=UPI00111AE66A|nr:relaxase MobL [Fructilactobacillus sanfranciscensis]TNK96023.1 hypothetical protein DKP74_01795 [Fructilactobacillus sanfranciscensis]TNL00047.1 hypothetical protein DK130_02345 [Fructilactobacillus sanfranciscensis]